MQESKCACVQVCECLSICVGTQAWAVWALLVKWLPPQPPSLALLAVQVCTACHFMKFTSLVLGTTGTMSQAESDQGGCESAETTVTTKKNIAMGRLFLWHSPSQHQPGSQVGILEEPAESDVLGPPLHKCPPFSLVSPTPWSQGFWWE